jgi:hypothetical protein
MAKTTMNPALQLNLIAGVWTDFFVQFNGVNGYRKSDFESNNLDTTIKVTTEPADKGASFEYSWVQSDKAG